MWKNIVVLLRVSACYKGVLLPPTTEKKSVNFVNFKSSCPIWKLLMVLLFLEDTSIMCPHELPPPPHPQNSSSTAQFWLWPLLVHHFDSFHRMIYSCISAKSHCSVQHVTVCTVRMINYTNSDSRLNRYIN